ncbi:succinyl-diaminopimelate desuccinylase, partial [Staphylococcus pseudintermedius]
MSVLSAYEKIQILRDIAQYLKNLFDKYQINAQILKLENSETRANLVAEIG